MGLQVIGAAFGRTGSHSLAQALAHLGVGPCYTIYDVKKNPSHVALWNDALAERTVDWQELFQGYASTVEWPAVTFLPQILEAFPQAKVILTLRDADAWYTSAEATIFDALELAVHNPNSPGRLGPAIDLTRRLVLERTFEGNHRDREATIALYNRHIQSVIDLVPADHLLQYRLAQGWEPICAFLDAPLPEEPFPHVNDRASFLSSAPEWMKRLRKDRSG